MTNPFVQATGLCTQTLKTMFSSCLLALSCKGKPLNPVQFNNKKLVEMNVA